MSVNKIILTHNSTTIDSESNYGVVLLDATNIQQRETANITTQTWNGENGEEVYIPSGGVVYKSYDATLTLGCKKTNSSTAREVKDAFINAIKGIEWSIQLPYYNITLNGCYLNKEEQDDQGEDWITFKLTIKVTNP